jgi:hypothetical protein
MLRYFFNKVETVFNLEIARAGSHLSDLSPATLSTIEHVRPYTMTSLDRLAAVCGAVEYAVQNNIPGAFVECGVWRGGSSMAAALTYLQMGRENVDLFFFDTFEGMPEPGAEDVFRNTGAAAQEILADPGCDSSMKCYAPIDDVRRNLASTKYPTVRLHFVRPCQLIKVAAIYK